MNPLLIVAAVLAGKLLADATTKESAGPPANGEPLSSPEPAVGRPRAYRDPPDLAADPAEPEAPQLSSTGQSDQLSTDGQSEPTAEPPDAVQPDQIEEPDNGNQQAD